MAFEECPKLIVFKGRSTFKGVLLQWLSTDILFTQQKRTLIGIVYTLMVIKKFASPFFNASIQDSVVSRIEMLDQPQLSNDNRGSRQQVKRRIPDTSLQRQSINSAVLPVLQFGALRVGATEELAYRRPCSRERTANWSRGWCREAGNN